MTLLWPLLLACRVETGLRTPPGAEAVALVPLGTTSVGLPTTPAAPVADAAVPAVRPPAPPEPPAPCPLLPDPAALQTCDPQVAALSGGVGWPSVAEALARAPDLAEVVVCPGTWDGGLLLEGGRSLAAADPTPGATVLQGSPDGPVLVATAETSLRGLTVRGGRADRGAGLSAAGDVDLTCVRFEDNVAGAGDGGAVSASGQITAAWSEFVDNESAASGGALSGTDLAVSDCVFTLNDGRDGGALAATGAVEIARTVFLDNGATTGGAVSLGPWAVTRSTFTDVAFHGNSGQRGGAIWSHPWAPAVLAFERVVFAGNLASEGAGAVELAGDHAVDLSLVDAAFDGNAGGDSGGIGLSGWLDRGVRLTLATTRFDDGVGGIAGALWASSLAGPARITGADLQMWRNEGRDGAASLRAGDTFECDACDFGADENDNVPTDATFGDQAEGALPAAF